MTASPCGQQESLEKLNKRRELLQEAAVELSYFRKPMNARERLLLAFRAVLAGVQKHKRREKMGKELLKVMIDVLEQQKAKEAVTPAANATASLLGGFPTHGSRSARFSPAISQPVTAVSGAALAIAEVQVAYV